LVLALTPPHQIENEATFYKAVRLVGRKVWQLAVPDGLRVVGPDEQPAGEKRAAQLEVRLGVQRVAEQDA
jgi:hypothetical protein